MDRYAFDVAKQKSARSIDGRALRSTCAIEPLGELFMHVERTKKPVISEGNHSRILSAQALDGADGAQGTLEANVLSSIEEFVQANG
jgi:hypothetical protein